MTNKPNHKGSAQLKNKKQNKNKYSNKANHPNNNPKRKRARLMNILINFTLVVLLAVGLALIFNVQIRNFFIKKNGEAYSVNNITKQEIDTNMNADTTFDFDAVEPLSTEAVLRAQLSNKYLPVIGAIAIPSVKINLPIFRGLLNNALFAGAGTMDPDQKMGQGNYALASHRVQDMVSLFSPLEYAQIGELIYITDLADIYTYKITLVETVDPTRVDLLDEIENKKMITLVTCGDMYAITRIVVQGELTSVTPIKNSTAEMTEAFQMEQRVLL